MAYDIDGTDEFAKIAERLYKLPARLRAEVFQAGLARAAQVVRTRARRRNFEFGDDTGALRKSIVVRRTRERVGGVANISRSGVRRRGLVGGTTTLGAVVRLGGREALYGPLIELGTDRIAARRPLRQAVETTTEEQLTKGVEAMRRRLVRTIQKLSRE